MGNMGIQCFYMVYQEGDRMLLFLQGTHKKASCANDCRGVVDNECVSPRSDQRVVDDF